VKCKGQLFGLRVDRAREVIRIDRTTIKTVQSQDSESAIEGVVVLPGDRIVQVIDPDRVFQKYDLPLIANASDGGHRVETIERVQCITIALDGQEHGLEVGGIREIIKVPEIKKRIDLGEQIKGVIHLRGECITLVDLRVHLGLEERPIDLDSRVLIIAGPVSYGLLVDGVHEVVSFEKRLLLSMPPLANRRNRQLYKGVATLQRGGKARNLILLDLPRLFSEEELSQLRQNAGLHDESRGDTRATSSTASTTQARSVEKRTYLSFKLQEQLALDLVALKEILVYSTEILPVPGQAEFLEGVLNLRGDVIPIVKLRTFFELDPRPRTGTEKIIVIDDGSRRAGLVVDEIQEIVQLDPSAACLQGIVIAALEKRRMFKGVVREVLSVSKNGRDTTLMVFNAKKLLDAIYPRIAENLRPTDDQAEASLGSWPFRQRSKR
jgi:purine-binding chemotaxis protein CheW